MNKNRKVQRQKTSREIQSDLEKMGLERDKEAQMDRLNAISHFQINKDIKHKNAKQKLLCKTIMENEITFVAGAAGTGKAQPLTEPILTPGGFVEIGSIRPGDKVISVDGTPVNVNSIHPQGEKDVYKVSFSDGTHTLCCGEHLWETQTEADRNNRKKRNGVAIREPLSGAVKTTFEIKESLLTNRGRKNHSIPICNPIQFANKELIINPYLMGCLIGDGCYSQHFVSFSSADEEIICEFKQSLPHPVKISKKPGDNYDYYITTKTRSNKANNLLLFEVRDLGLMGQKSHEKIIPDKYLYSSVEDRVELLRGLMDTDGHIPKNGSSIEYYTTSQILASQVMELIRSLGGISSIRTKKPFFTDKFGEKKQGKICYVVTVLFETLNPFKLSRKAGLFSDKKRMKIKYITGVEKQGEEECVCIHIDHPRHLYVTRDYNVTHNTLLSLKTALELLKIDNEYSQIILTKPIVEAGESIGFLPGDIDSKIDPYMDSFLGNFKKLVGSTKTKDFIQNDVVKYVPLAYLRGETFENSVAIIDEAQNTTVAGLKLWISRKGESSKLIIIGDTDQTDLYLRNGQRSGLDDAFNRFQGLPKIGFIQFTEDEIVRSGILIDVMKRYKLELKS